MQGDSEVLSPFKNSPAFIPCLHGFGLSDLYAVHAKPFSPNLFSTVSRKLPLSPAFFAAPCATMIQLPKSTTLRCASGFGMQLTSCF